MCKLQFQPGNVTPGSPGVPPASQRSNGMLQSWSNAAVQAPPLLYSITAPLHCVELRRVASAPRIAFHRVLNAPSMMRACFPTVSRLQSFFSLQRSDETVTCHMITDSLRKAQDGAV